MGAAAAGGGDVSIPVFFDPVSSTRELFIAVGILALAMQSSEDLTCIAAGILVSDGFIGFWWAVLGCFLGILLGDVGLYLIGRVFGRTALKWKWMRRILPEYRVAHWARGFEKRGFGLIVLSRFVPGSRVPIYFAAGMLRMPFVRFFLYLNFAAALWTPALVGISAWLGHQFLQWFEAHRTLAAFGLIAAVIVLYLVIHKGIPLFTWRGRRMALGFWRRVLRWEFWPRQILYPPVLVYIAGLMVKYRSFTLPTAVNPGMPCGGGFLMEKKSEIFSGMTGVPELPAWMLFEAGSDPDGNISNLNRFMTEADLNFPIVLKPNIGQRGHFVSVIESGSEASDYFERHSNVEVIAQEYAGGVEFGVFYLRQPDDKQGRIYSITDKRFTSVTGDGITTLENLILHDNRAVCMAKTFLRQFAERIDQIPAEGETFPLAKLGTHCQGAMFLDGRHLVTPELETAIDRISKAYEGFFFGRFDIKAPSVAEFQAGENLSILELNGLTSEATHIYQPGFSLSEAYRTLFEQWRIAFEIAAKNRDAGSKPLTFRELGALLSEYFRGDW